MVKSLLITIMEKLESKTIWGAQTLETVPENVPEHCVQTTEIKLQNDVSQNETWCFSCFRQSCKKHIGRHYRNIPLLVEKIDKETIFIISIKMDFFVSKNKLIYLTQM